MNYNTQASFELFASQLKPKLLAIYRNLTDRKQEKSH